MKTFFQNPSFFKKNGIKQKKRNSIRSSAKTKFGKELISF